ncbi:methionyl-tRNA formyltransferase [Aphanothece hegewaldii CCALA 016]|uniref:Methionyl-tRNA formyltransferase n=1 Tax=Aphanothece hegewaldii CCALA 016 TaxID=2107694 RepID=A0A2T1M270_9CHRO|nr:methionyl-tRNA formyltransferase [Aphanothece hegewaldii]PSF38856.1 methionyl-tRNA formyltransferase [Aphanothece hegewaldii CCALA 016]
MKIVFFGTPFFAVPTLEALLNSPNFEIIAVVTQPDKRRGRGNQLLPSPIKKLALEHQLPVWQPKRIKKAKETLSRLKETQADVFVVVAYGQILSPEILAMPRLGCINVHGSLLPKYRGAAPIQWSIYHGETETGITTMLMDEGMDTGAMLLTARTPIGLLDNAEQISSRLSQQGANLLIETLSQLEQEEIEATPQNSTEATYAPLIQKEDYQIDWTKSAIAIHNQVRGLYPDCFAFFRDQTLKITATVPLISFYWSELSSLQKIPQTLPTFAEGTRGQIVGILKNIGPVVQTGDGLLVLLQVQLAGKRPQSGKDFINGVRLAAGVDQLS